MTMLGKLSHFLYALASLITLVLIVHGQDQTGFISIDCGLPANSSYTEQTTGLFYDSDATFVDTGESKLLSLEQRNNYQQQIWHLRYFPEGIRNCYSIDIISGTKYLIRATFFYGDYNGQNKAPKFDLYLGPNLWDTINSNNTIMEIIHVPLQDYVHVCLVNTGYGTPYISAIELRPLNSTTYETQMGSLALFTRVDMGTITNETYRYKDDALDRIWYPFHRGTWTQVTTSLVVDESESDSNSYHLPSAVMSSAAIPTVASDPLSFWWLPADNKTQYYVYLHFAEVVKLQTNQSRNLSITWNGEPFYKPFVPSYLYSTTVYSTIGLTGGLHNFSIFQVGNSTLPPIINAVEIYELVEFLQAETNQEDVHSIKNIKLTYGVKRNWQGDPCSPPEFLWEGLNCSYDGQDPPRIISLNLSSSGLIGEIAPSLSKLTMLQTLDLSNNNLTGSVPDFLSQLTNLKILNLEKNKLTGSVPAGLLDKSNDGSLSLSLCGNQNLTAPISCGKETNKKKKKKDNLVVPVVASVAGIFILLLVVGAVWWGLKRKRKHEPDVTDSRPSIQQGSMESAQRQFTHSEIVEITKNFERTLGRGGFGTVYYGRIDNIEVAVKMLSPSSIQGYHEFHSEVNLLMRVHHRNLTGLVGYCNDGDNLGLIYEYMANGNLQKRLSGQRKRTDMLSTNADSSSNMLNWADRLRIAVDAAHGLEYLHYGCKPPIIHRDVKSANILLNQNFQAKLSDFGLSRNFPAEDVSRVWTRVAGTPGYLDPEYYQSNMLNEKSDVYSFGIVLLELITNRPVLTKTHEKIHIAQWASFMVDKGDINSIADPRLKGNFDSNSVWKAVELAVACVHPNSINRPTMSEVVINLNECLEAETAREKERQGTESKDSVELMSLKFTTEMRPLAR